MGRIQGSFAAALAMAMAVLAGAACSGGGGGGGGAKFSDTECAECIGTACTAEIATCLGLDDCGAAVECVLDCPEDDNALDTTCAQTECTALVTTSAGGTAFDAVLGCYLDESATAGTCGSECSPPTE